MTFASLFNDVLLERMRTLRRENNTIFIDLMCCPPSPREAKHFFDNALCLCSEVIFVKNQNAPDFIQLLDCLCKKGVQDVIIIFDLELSRNNLKSVLYEIERLLTEATYITNNLYIIMNHFQYICFQRRNKFLTSTIRTKVQDVVLPNLMEINLLNDRQGEALEELVSSLFSNIWRFVGVEPQYQKAQLPRYMRILSRTRFAYFEFDIASVSDIPSFFGNKILAECKNMSRIKGPQITAFLGKTNRLVVTKAVDTLYFFMNASSYPELTPFVENSLCPIIFLDAEKIEKLRVADWLQKIDILENVTRYYRNMWRKTDIAKRLRTLGFNQLDW